MYCDLWPYLWLVFKSGFWSRAAYSGARMVYQIKNQHSTVISLIWEICQNKTESWLPLWSSLLCLQWLALFFLASMAFMNKKKLRLMRTKITKFQAGLVKYKVHLSFEHGTVASKIIKIWILRWSFSCYDYYIWRATCICDMFW